MRYDGASVARAIGADPAWSTSGSRARPPRSEVRLEQKPSRPQNTGAAMTQGMNQASYGLSVAFAFVATLLVFFFAGRWIDEALGITPWAQVVGAIAGWVLGVVVVVQASQRGLR